MSANITRKKVIIANNKIVKATLVKDFYIFKSKKLKNRLEKMKLKPNLHFSISFKALDLILHSQVCGKLFSLFSYQYFANYILDYYWSSKAKYVQNGNFLIHTLKLFKGGNNSRKCNNHIRQSLSSVVQVNLFQKHFILASINPQYDKRLFMELPWKLQAQNMGRTWAEHVLRL